MGAVAGERGADGVEHLLALLGCVLVGVGQLLFELVVLGGEISQVAAGASLLGIGDAVVEVGRGTQRAGHEGGLEQDERGQAGGVEGLAAGDGGVEVGGVGPRDDGGQADGDHREGPGHRPAPCGILGGGGGRPASAGCGLAGEVGERRGDE